MCAPQFRAHGLILPLLQDGLTLRLLLNEQIIQLNYSLQSSRAVGTLIALTLARSTKGRVQDN